MNEMSSQEATPTGGHNDENGSDHGIALQKLKSLLKTLFQLSLPELDFGIYRIMNYKRKEIEEFTDRQLEEAIEREFEKYRSVSRSELSKELETKRREIEGLEQNLGEKILRNGDVGEKFRDKPIAKEYLEIKSRLDQAEVTDIVKVQVFNDLFNFFSRYYEDGDFISKKRYSAKQEKYAIPYSGEEVKLHWATADQYYVKTGEIFRDYQFRADSWRIIFGTTVVDIPVGNTKEERRYFVLRKDAPVSVDPNGKVCTIQFEYRPLAEDDVSSVTKSRGEGRITVRQEELNSILRDNIVRRISHGPLKSILSKGEGDRTLLEKHLYKYTRKITSDFFIHKDLGGFLERELAYFIATEVVDLDDLEPRHVTRASVVESIGRRIIEFLAQIEEFEKNLWEKKKFVLSTDYVIGLKTLQNVLSSSEYASFETEVKNKISQDGKIEIDLKSAIQDAFNQPGNNVYVKWVEFRREAVKVRYAKRFDDEAEFKEYHKGHRNARVAKENDTIRGESRECWFIEYHSDKLPDELVYSDLYIDTKYFDDSFKSRLLESVSRSRNLDDLIQGVLVKSEGWQALNLLFNKYQDKVKCVYIDPPYNTGSDEFLYKDNYRHSSWLTMMADRLVLGKRLMRDEGSFYVSIDWNESHLLKKLLDMVFDEENFQREIIWNTGENISGFKSLAPNWIRQHDTIYFYSKDGNRVQFNKLWKPIDEKVRSQFNWADIVGADKDSLFIEKWLNGKLSQVPVKDTDVKALGDVWNDIFSFQYSEPRVTESWFFPTQKVEDLLRRIIQAATKPKELVLDCFLGSGTTAAVAHKLDRRWVGVEMADYFETHALARIKSVIIGERRTHLSKEIDWQGGGFVKYHILEQYEDTLHNIEFPNAERGKKALESFMDTAPIQEYLLKYFLRYETTGSPSTISVKQFETPFEYKLNIISNAKGEETVSVDLVETFNYLIGLTTNKILSLEDQGRKYVFVLGERRGRRVAIVWRPTIRLNLEKDRELVEEKVKEYHPDEIFSNGDSLVPNYRIIEREFKALMGV